MKIQILISKNSWVNKYKHVIKNSLNIFSRNILFLDDHKKLKKKYDINIIFSYFKKIEKKFLNYSKYNLVPHESKLPKGRGMSPITWQILEGKKNITFSLIEAAKKFDSGKIYFQKNVKINEFHLFEEIKKIQLNNNLDLLKKFLKYYKKYNINPKTKNQKVIPTYYKLRKPSDSKINLNKSIKSQFNLLRVCDFDNYPAYFYYKKKKILIKLQKKNK